MEHSWSRAVATSGNRWQIQTPRKRLQQAKTVATGCDQLPIGAHGKEGSTVRVRQRASQNSLQIWHSLCPYSKCLSRAGTCGHVSMFARRSHGRAASRPSNGTGLSRRPLRNEKVGARPPVASRRSRRTATASSRNDSGEGLEHGPSPLRDRAHALAGMSWSSPAHTDLSPSMRSKLLR
jgi:hypothetical protein